MEPNVSVSLSVATLKISFFSFAEHQVFGVWTEKGLRNVLILHCLSRHFCEPSQPLQNAMGKHMQWVFLPVFRAFALEGRGNLACCKSIIDPASLGGLSEHVWISRVALDITAQVDSRTFSSILFRSTCGQLEAVI